MTALRRRPAAIALLAAVCLLAVRPASAQVNVILDSDMGPDVDDAGALAVLHTYAELGQANILATITSNGSKQSALTMDIINTYYGRPDIPIAMNHSGTGVAGIDDAGWAHKVANDYSSQTDLDPNNIRDATDLYREVLAGAADNSVDIVVTGWQSNLSNLLSSGPDGYSSLTGAELVSQKVRQLTVMGASDFPEASEDGFNLLRDIPAGVDVIENWNSQQVWSAGSLGGFVLTGRELLTAGDTDNPVRSAYLTLFGGDEYRLRPSWDQTAVMYAVEGEAGFYDLISDGHIQATVGTDGDGDANITTEWLSPDDPNHAYIEAELHNKVAWHLDALMAGDAPSPYPSLPGGGVALTYNFAYDAQGYVNDSSGNGFRATVVNINDWSDGAGDTGEGFVTGGGLRLVPGGPRAYVDIPLSLSEEDGLFSRSFTLEVEAIIEDIDGAFSPLFGMSDSEVNLPGFNDRFFLAKERDKTTFELRVGNDRITGIDLGDDFAEGQLHQYVLVYDQDAQELAFLFEGEQVALMQGFVPAFDHLGVLRLGNMATGDAVWNGTIKSVSLSFVPEPASMTLLVTGLGLLAYRRHRPAR